VLDEIDGMGMAGRLHERRIAGQQGGIGLRKHGLEASADGDDRRASVELFPQNDHGENDFRGSAGIDRKRGDGTESLTEMQNEHAKRKMGAEGHAGNGDVVGAFPCIFKGGNVPAGECPRSEERGNGGGGPPREGEESAALEGERERAAGDILGNAHLNDALVHAYFRDTTEPPFRIKRPEPAAP